MSRTRTGALALIVSLLVLTTDGFGGAHLGRPSDEPYTGSHFARVNLIVTDMDRALKLCRDILGFRMDVLTDSPTTSFSYPLFDVDKDVKLKRAFLSAGNDQLWTIALTEIDGVDAYTPPRPFRAAMVIEAPGPVEDLKAKLEAEGIDVDTAWDITAPSGKEHTDLSFTDHDGHRFVVFVNR